MKKNLFNTLYILVGLLFVSHYFNYSDWSSTRGPLLIQFYTAFTLVYVLFKFIYLSHRKRPNDKIVLWLIVSCTLTLITCFTTNRSMFQSQRDFLLILSMLPTYFFLKARRVSKQEIIYASTIFIIVTFLIQVYQKLNFTHPLFGYVDMNEYGESIFRADDQRNNLFRFNIGISVLGEFCLCYYWNKVIDKYSFKKLILFAISAISVYLYLTRQLMVASLVTVLFSFIFIKDKKMRRWGFVGVLVFAAILLINYDLIFKDLVELSSTETYSTDIRKVAYSFIFSQVFNDPFLWLVGHGHTLEEIGWTNKGLYCSDIGFVGQMYLQGVLWVIIYFYTLYKFLWRQRRKLPLYLKLYFFCTMIHSPMIFPYSNLPQTFVWMIALYLCTLEEDKRKLVNSKNEYAN